MTEENKQGRPSKYDDPKQAEREAKKRYREKNKERTAYLSDRSRARSFIRNKATGDDLDELQALIDERRSHLDPE
ncbi:hypothetical protein IE337_04085 [Weissella viridescens]|uniref:hypothetical protein n=1 Tax=Weissella viridescens TaxID=1629 RepID=UPI00174762E7|nr:hypothetical protein [Weissella viridescens]QOD85393.1 hypothetical protein IE337_04085 [Weissella viridescens]WJI90496.1 hypothetical protein PWA48_04060 [Weissella viridescens]